MNGFAIHPATDLAMVRRLLDAYFTMLNGIKAVRSEMVAERAPLGERIAAAGIQEDLEVAIREAQRRLSRVARRGRASGVSA